MYYPCSENDGAVQHCSYAKLICAFVFAYYAKCLFPHDVALDGNETTKLKVATKTKK